MDLMEYQAKELFAKHDVPVTLGTVIENAAEAETAAAQLGGRVVVKAQVKAGGQEERAAEFIKDHMTKPVIGYVAGFTAPEGKTMGHAGAIVSGSSGTAQAKQEALEAAGVKVGKTPSETAQQMREALENLLVIFSGLTATPLSST